MKHIITSLFCVLFCSCAKDRFGASHYVGPSMRVSLTWKGVEAGVTFYKELPEIPAVQPAEASPGPGKNPVPAQ
jgi:hypothetical protein